MKIYIEFLIRFLDTKYPRGQILQDLNTFELTLLPSTKFAALNFRPDCFEELILYYRFSKYFHVKIHRTLLPGEHFSVSAEIGRYNEILNSL